MHNKIKRSRASAQQNETVGFCKPDITFAKILNFLIIEIFNKHKSALQMPTGTEIGLG